MRDKRAEKKLLSFIFAILILFLYITQETTLGGVYDFFTTFGIRFTFERNVDGVVPTLML